MDSFRQICLATNQQKLAKGQFLLRQGEKSNSVYIIKEGHFKIIRINPEGNETILQFVGSGEIIGEAALFRSEKIQVTTAVSIEEARVCSASCYGWHMIMVKMYRGY